MTRALSGRSSERRPLSLDLLPPKFGARSFPQQLLRSSALPAILSTGAAPERDGVVVVDAFYESAGEALRTARPRREDVKAVVAAARETVDGTMVALPKPAEPFCQILLSSYLFFRTSKPLQSRGHGTITQKQKRFSE